MTMKRAWSTLAITKAEGGAGQPRRIEGIASSPSTDRMGDVVEPMGAQYTLPIPLLWQHKSSLPIGHVLEATVTKAGIRIVAELVEILEPGALKDRLDEAWQSLKSGLVRGLSIGFNPIEHAQIDGTWGVRFTKWEWLELSAVTIPANADASITAIKSIGARELEASGRGTGRVVRLDSTPGVSGNPKPPEKGNDMKTIAERIAAFEAKRMALHGSMTAIMDKADEAGSTLDTEAKTTYDESAAEIKEIDEHLGRLRAQESFAVSKGVVVPPRAGVNAETSTETRGGVVLVKDNLPKGVEFARYVKCLAAAHGNRSEALEIAKAHYGDNPRIATVLKAAVAAGTTTDATWAGSLVDYAHFVGDFVEFLRPQTIIGKFGQNGIPDLNKVPFNIQIPRQTSGGNGYWVGQGAPKPLTKFDFDNILLRWAKVANIAVLTDELVRFSNPAADVLVRNALAAALVERMDIDFVDPSKAAVADVSPASITYGVTPITPSGVTADAVRDDVAAIMAPFIAANITPANGVWIMSATTALNLSLMRNTLGQKEFPDITMLGGKFEGLPVIVSQYVTNTVSGGSVVVLVNASDIYLSDDGQVTIDASREASLQMLDNPTNNSSTGTATTMVSMFQTNSVAVRAERYINWAKRRAAAAQYLDGVHWG